MVAELIECLESSLPSEWLQRLTAKVHIVSVIRIFIFSETLGKQRCVYLHQVCNSLKQLLVCRVRPNISARSYPTSHNKYSLKVKDFTVATFTELVDLGAAHH